MPFIGNQPTAVPLTSADITDGIITSAKIANGTITATDMDLSGTYAFTGTVTGAGGTNTPAFKAYGTTQSIANDTVTKLAWGTEVFDTDNCYDNTTYTFTPNVAGKYFVYGIVRLETSADGFHNEMKIYKNGSVFAAFLNATDYYDSLHVSALVDMNGTTDYITWHVYHSVGVSLNTYSGQEFNHGGAFRILT